MYKLECILQPGVTELCVMKSGQAVFVWLYTSKLNLFNYLLRLAVSLSKPTRKNKNYLTIDRRSSLF